MSEPLDSGSGTEIVYFVEARTVGGVPIRVGGMTLDGQWRRLHPERSKLGVPSRLLSRQAEAHGYVSHPAAIAIAAWFRAMPEDDERSPLGFPAFSVETRIVAVQWTWRYTATRVGEGPAESSVAIERAFTADVAPPTPTED